MPIFTASNKHADSDRDIDVPMSNMINPNSKYDYKYNSLLLLTNLSLVLSRLSSPLPLLLKSFLIALAFGLDLHLLLLALI